MNSPFANNFDAMMGCWHLETASSTMTSPFAKNSDPTTGGGRKLRDMAAHSIPNPYNGSTNQTNAAFDDDDDDFIQA